jgi:hypothetical protein
MAVVVRSNFGHDTCVLGRGIPSTIQHMKEKKK